jgi:hypothetical protein
MDADRAGIYDQRRGAGQEARMRAVGCLLTADMAASDPCPSNRRSDRRTLRHAGIAIILLLVSAVAAPGSAQAGPDPVLKKATVTSPAGSGAAYKRKRTPTVSSRAAGETLGSTAIDTVAGRPPRTINPSGDPRPLPRCPDCAPKPGAKPTGGPAAGTNASNNNSPSIPASGGAKGNTVPSGGHGGVSLVQPGGVSVPQPLPPAPAPTISSGGTSPPGAPK